MENKNKYAERYGRWIGVNEIVVEDLSEEVLLKIGDALALDGFNVEYWKAPKQASGHLHIKNIQFPPMNPLSNSQKLKYKEFFMKQYIPEEYWDKVDWNFVKTKRHRIAEEGKEHYKGYGIKTLIRTWNEKNENKAILGLIYEAQKHVDTSIESNLKDYTPILTFISPHWVEGKRQEMALIISGFCRKELRMGVETIKDIIKGICKISNDNEISQRLNAVETTFKKDEGEIKGITGLIEMGIDPNPLIELFKKPSEGQNEGLTNEEAKQVLKECFDEIGDILRDYLVLREEYYDLVALWIIGTYFHKNFNTFPYLFINAMKGSGKTRLLKLIASLSYNGEILASLREAVLFRTAKDGTICIDEFERVGNKEQCDLRELLNSAYKKGTKVKRMKKIKGEEGDEQVVEEFEVYCPIAIANIWGMESVLGDRCIHLILEKSNNPHITALIEDFSQNFQFSKIIFRLNQCSCVVNFANRGYINLWNKFIRSGISANNYTNYTNCSGISANNYTYNTNYIYNTNYTNYTNIFEKIKESKIEGRYLELFFPLFLMASNIREDLLDKIIEIALIIVNEKKTDEFLENKELNFIEFVSEQADEGFIEVSEVTRRFKQYLHEEEEEIKWINTRWVGKALKRLNLNKEKRRVGKGIEVILNTKKAKEKNQMFKPLNEPEGAEQEEIIKEAEEWANGVKTERIGGTEE